MALDEIRPIQEDVSSITLERGKSKNKEVEAAMGPECSSPVL